MRLWEVMFLTAKPFESLPKIHEIVFEEQSSPEYRIQTRPLHFTETQIVCTISGEGCFEHKGQVFHLTPGKAFMSSLAEPETVYYYPPEGKVPWRFLWVSFLGRNSVDCIAEFNKRYGFVVDIAPDSEFIRTLQTYRSNHGQTIFCDAAESAIPAVNLFSQLEKCLMHEPAERRSMELVRQAQQMILDRLCENPPLQEIAERLHVSREHLIRLFREHSGETPGNFAMRERMNLARHLIHYEFRSCGEVADRLGFASPASFIRSYKNWYGVTPFGSKIH